MKKLETANERDKRERRNRLLIGIILIVIMIISTGGYALYQNRDEPVTQNEKQYDGLTFIYNGDTWQTQIQGYDFSFMFVPQDTENITADIQLTVNDYSGKPLYLVGNSPGESEILRNINRFASRVQRACYENCKDDLPVKNCTDNLIIFNESAYPKIVQDENCVFISSPVNEAVRTSDAFLYKIFGIR